MNERADARELTIGHFLLERHGAERDDFAFEGLVRRVVVIVVRERRRTLFVVDVIVIVVRRQYLLIIIYCRRMIGIIVISADKNIVLKKRSTSVDLLLLAQSTCRARRRRAARGARRRAVRRRAQMREMVIVELVLFALFTVHDRWSCRRGDAVGPIASNHQSQASSRRRDGRHASSVCILGRGKENRCTSTANQNELRAAAPVCVCVCVGRFATLDYMFVTILCHYYRMLSDAHYRQKTRNNRIETENEMSFFFFCCFLLKSSKKERRERERKRESDHEIRKGKTGLNLPRAREKT